MRQKSPNIRLIPLMTILLAAVLGLGSCGDRANVKTPSTDTSTTMGPAPDNNSATNPSLADTGYEKNRTRPITDTVKKN